MVAKMQQPWHDGYDGNPASPHEDYHQHDDMRDTTNLSRSSLGQLIERSTSAPPSSDQNRDSSLFGNSKFLGHVNGSSQQAAMNNFFRPNSVVDSTAPTPVLANPPYAENPAPENETFRAAMMSSMIDNSGRATAPALGMGGGSGNSALRSGGGGTTSSYGALAYDFGSSNSRKDDFSSLGIDPFQRSHSAAPPSPAALGPPPGLPALGQDTDRRGGLALPRRTISEIRRPASTGVLDSSSSSALRPSAKTLMDLIQEDYPDDNPEPARVSYFPGDTTPTFATERFNHLASATTNQQVYSQQQQQDSFGENRYLSPQQLQQQQLPLDRIQPQVQHIRLDSATGGTSHIQMQHVPSMGGRDANLGAAIPPHQQHNIHQQHAGQQVMAQRYVQPGFDGRDSAGPEGASSLYQPANQLRPPQQQQIQHQQHGQPVYLNSSGRPQQQHGSIPQQHGQIIIGQDGQQIYYQQPVEVAPPRLQAQVLPNGQTVYIQAPAPQSQQPGQGYSYATNQYQQQPVHTSPDLQQPRIVPGPATLIRQSDGTYIQVPVQGGAVPQVAYWTGENGQQQTIVVNAPGVGGHMQPQTVNMGHMSNPQQQQQHVGVDQQYSPGGQHQQQQRHVSGQQQQHGAHQQYGGGRGGGGGRDSRNKQVAAPPGGEVGGGRPRRGGNQSRRGAETKGHSTSSPLLEDFRTNKNRQWTVPQIEGHVVEFCQDQNGSRFIQQRLELGDRLEQDIVVREVLPAIRRLRNDVFGNYVVQKLLDFGSPQVRASIRDTLEGEMLQLSLQMYGCRVVQKALESLEDHDLSRLLEEFRHNVLSCIHDQNGNHVIQKCIEVMNARAKTADNHGDYERAQRTRELIDFIVNDILVNATTLSCHPFGCRVLQRILEHSDDQRKTMLLDEVMKSHKRLLDDQYGNYVIQHVLQYGRVIDRDSILSIVVESGLLILSRQKFASNVVEKLLKYGNGPQRKAIAREMLQKTDESSAMNIQGGDTSVVLLMVRDAYANYVVQTTLDVVPNSEERTLLLEELNSHSEELRNYTFAKHIVAKLTALEEAK